ncbi:MAG: DNA repair protein RadC [Aggregatilineales bacterium]
MNTSNPKPDLTEPTNPTHMASDTTLLANLIAPYMELDIAHALCQSLLLHFGGLQSLCQRSAEDIMSVGIDEFSARQITIAIEIGNRLSTYRADNRPIIKNAEDAAQLMLDMRRLNQEHIRVILLDNARRVIAVPTVYIGTVNAAVLRTSEIYREAIIRNAPALILVHNHPSGDATPSPEDIELTRALLKAGKLLDIVFVDHLIIGNEDWCSLKELKLGF